jgi:hypothetical protein
VLESLLAALGPNDRVQIVAVDVEPQLLTGSFVESRSPQVAAAIDQLYERTPLGSTDMAAVLETMGQLVDEASSRPRSAVYIGDGVTVGNLLGGERAEAAIKQLVDRKVAVSSYAVGPQTNNALLAAVANRSGGMLVIDDVETTLKRSAHTWPESSRLRSSGHPISSGPPRLPPFIRRCCHRCGSTATR